MLIYLSFPTKGSYFLINLRKPSDSARQMIFPNWQHHSKKEAKRHLKPQALRQARKRTRQLKKCLLNPPKRRVSYYNVYIQRKSHAKSGS